MSKVVAYAQDWHQRFVSDAREFTGCSHEAAFAILGLVIDLRESSQQQGYARGFDTAQQELLDRLTAGVEIPEAVTYALAKTFGLSSVTSAHTQLLEYGAAQRLKLAQAMHYPECWDTAAYPTLESALHEAYSWAKCNAHEGEVKHD